MKGLFIRHKIKKLFKTRRNTAGPTEWVIVRDYYREQMSETENYVVIKVRYNNRGKIFDTKVLAKAYLPPLTVGYGLSDESTVASFMYTCKIRSLFDPQETKKFTTYERD